MFVKNSYHQMSLDNPLNSMPKYLRNILEKSWAHKFQKYIFPAINEERFAILYSSNGSRPNSPVNVIIGLLIIKELFGQTDEELVGSLHFDDRYKYALRTLGFEKQPVSLNTITNFRKRVSDYCEEEGIDLVQEEIEALSQTIAIYLNIDDKSARMDSFMVNSSCKNLSRIELIYTVNRNFIQVLKENHEELIPEDCKGYLQKGHKNETIYKSRDKKVESKLEFLIKQSYRLHKAGLKAGNEVTGTDEFKLLERMLEEQTKDNDDDDSDQITPRDSKDIAPDSLQNPSDPDATYRYKYGDNIGYSANVMEIFNNHDSIIKTYDLQPNIYDDSKFARDVIEKLAVDDELQLLVDGAYYSYENAKDASKNNIDLIPRNLRGRKPTESKLSYAYFTVDKEENIINNCPTGKKPIESTYDKEKEIYSAKLAKDDCNGCLYCLSCRIQEQKKFYKVRFSAKDYQTALLRQRMETKEYMKLTNKRAGIEGIPSVFRRKYQIDQVPTRGKVRLKIWFGFKVAAYNVKKLFKRLSESGLKSILEYIFGSRITLFNFVS